MLLVVAAAVYAVVGQKTATGDLDDLKKPVFVTAKDYKVIVLKSKIPWIFLFSAGSEIPAAAESLASELDAISRVGVVNTANKKDSLLSEMVREGLGCERR